MTAAACGVALAVAVVVVPAFLLASRRRPLPGPLRAPRPLRPRLTTPLTSTLAVLAAVSSWHRFQECRDAGRQEEGAMYRDQARWRARLAAKRRAGEADDTGDA